MTVKFSNSGKALITSTVYTHSQTVDVDDASVFPSIVDYGNDYFYVTFQNPSTGASEICKVTDVMGNKLFIERAQDGTTAGSFGAGDKCENRLNAGALIEAVNDFDITSQTDPKYLRSNTDDTTTHVITSHSDAKWPLVIGKFVGGSHNQKIKLQGSASPNIDFCSEQHERMMFGYSSLGYGQWYVHDGDNNSARLKLDEDGTLKLTATVSADGVTSETYSDATVFHSGLFTNNATDWDTAYSWGDHADAGYLTSESDTLQDVAARGNTLTTNVKFSEDEGGIEWYRNTDAASIKFYNDSDGDTNSRLEFHVRDNKDEFFLFTSYDHTTGENTELLKIHPTADMTLRGNKVYDAGDFTNNATNWDTAYSWGDHSGLYLGATATAADSDKLDGYHKSDINPAHSHYRWTDIKAASAQAKRHRVMRLYGCPAHWDSRWQNIHFKVWSESYEATYLEYVLAGDYNGGVATSMYILRLKDASGSAEHKRFRLLLGDPVAAGWDHSGQPTYYVDVYAEAAHYMNFTVAAEFYSAGFAKDTLPTSGGASTVVFTDPDETDIDNFSESKTDFYLADNKVLHDGNFTDNSGNWNTAHGWGNHADAGYLTSHQDISGKLDKSGGTITGDLTVGDVEISVKSIGAGAVGLQFQPNENYKCIHPTTFDDVDHADSISFGWSNNKWKDGWFAGVVNASGGDSDDWNTAYSWGDHADAGYLTSHQDISGKLDTSGGTMTGVLTVNKDGDALNLRSTTNAEPTRITFSSDVPAAQIGHIEYNHSDAKSYGSNEAFIIGGSEPTMTFLADGKLMFKDGIYSKPASGTGAGTRKDANWDTAYGWGNHADAGYLTNHDPAVLTSLGNSSDLDTLAYRAGMYGWSTSTTGKPSDNYGQVLSIVSSGNAHNDSTNWITQLGFGTGKNTAHFRGKTNDGSWGDWKTFWHTGNFTDNSSNWDTAYGWGNHADAGYAASSHGHEGLKGAWATIDLNSVAGSDYSFQWDHYSQASTNKPGASTPDNANGVITANTHTSNYRHQIAFHSDEQFYHRAQQAGTWGGWNKVLHDSMTTQTSNITIRNASPTLYLRDTNHNSAMLHANSDIFYVLRGGDDDTAWSQVNSKWPMEINLTNNNATFGGNVTAYSDASLKENVSPIGNSMEMFNQIEAKRFDWIVDGKHDIGFIAQDVQAAGLTEVVIQKDERDPDTGELLDTKLTLDYSRMVSVLWDVVKDLKEEVDDLKAKLEDKD